MVGTLIYRKKKSNDWKFRNDVASKTIVEVIPDFVLVDRGDMVQAKLRKREKEMWFCYKDSSAVKLLAAPTDSIFEVAFIKALEGHIIELATLLLVAADKIIDPMYRLNAKRLRPIYDMVLEEAMKLYEKEKRAQSSSYHARYWIDMLQRCTFNFHTWTIASLILFLKPDGSLTTKVQAIAWNQHKPGSLLSGSFYRTMMIV